MGYRPIGDMGYTADDLKMMQMGPKKKPKQDENIEVEEQMPMFKEEEKYVPPQKDGTDRIYGGGQTTRETPPATESSKSPNTHDRSGRRDVGG